MPGEDVMETRLCFVGAGKWVIMSYYCRIDSSGEETNLQLYSLKQAETHWNGLLDEIRKVGEDRVPELKEKMVFILNCFGLSLSQLLGQNWPYPTQAEMNSPGELLGHILKNSNIDRVNRRRLNKAFQDFLVYYGAIRHFGKTKDDRNYRAVEEITITNLDTFRRMTVEIWDTMIEIFQRDRDNDLDDLRSICDIVYFEEIAQPSAVPDG